MFDNFYFCDNLYTNLCVQTTYSVYYFCVRHLIFVTTYVYDRCNKQQPIDRQCDILHYMTFLTILESTLAIDITAIATYKVDIL